MNGVTNLASAVLYQAAKDYVKGNNNNKKQIIKDLNSSWMIFLTDGRSEIVAEQLIKHPSEIKKRIIYMKRHEMEVNANV